MFNYLGFTWLELIGRIPLICWITCMLQNTKQNKILVMHDYISTNWKQWNHICIIVVKLKMFKYNSGGLFFCIFLYFYFILVIFLSV